MASGNRLDLVGLDDFRRELRNLPESLSSDAAAIVLAAGAEAKTTLQEALPIGKTGNLRRGVSLRHEQSRFGASAVVRSGAKHASIFEKGTGTRTTSKGYNRGRMPTPPASQRLIPTAIRIRRGRMINALIDLVKRAGFSVQVGS